MVGSCAASDVYEGEEFIWFVWRPRNGCWNEEFGLHFSPGRNIELYGLSVSVLGIDNCFCAGRVEDAAKCREPVISFVAYKPGLIACNKVSSKTNEQQ